MTRPLSFLPLFFFTFSIMAAATQTGPGTARPPDLNKININGEEYWQTPQEANPELSEDLVWTQWPPDSNFISDPKWYNAIGDDIITQRRVWAVPTESGQIDQFRQLLHEFPDKSSDMMFAAAMKGKPHVVRFLLDQGVSGTSSDEAQPLHAAAYHGQIECVRMLIEDGHVDPNVRGFDDGTALMRACRGQRMDVLSYLLSLPAIDINARQIPDGTGMSALDFAAGSGCLECVVALLKHAETHDTDQTALITTLSIEAAASSNMVDLLRLLLVKSGYLVPDANANTFPDNICSLTSSCLDCIEASFVRAVEHSATTTASFLYIYLTSLSADGGPNYPALSEHTYSELQTSLTLLAVENDPESTTQAIALFDMLHNMVFSSNSQFTTERTIQNRPIILNDAFFIAAQFNNLPFLKHIHSLYPEVNPNHLSTTVKPQCSTTLYTSAGSAHNDVVKWLFNTFPTILDPNIAAGKFANGPTPLWITVWNGHTDTAKLLLQLGGGPVDSMDPELETFHVDTQAADEDWVKVLPPAQQARDHQQQPLQQSLPLMPKQVVLLATKTSQLPASVHILSHATLIRELETQGIDSSVDAADETGILYDAAGNEMHYLRIHLTEADREWWSGIQLRKSDEELLTMESGSSCERELKPRPVSGGWQNVAKYMSSLDS